MPKEELFETDNNSVFQKKFCEIYELRQILLHAIITPITRVSNFNWNAIHLTEQGDAIYQYLFQRGINQENIKYYIFLYFNHADLFVDILATDIVSFEKSFSTIIKNKEILFPWIFDNLLYSKYFYEFEEQSSELDNASVLKLLDNTPQGVFQFGHWVIGPLGILRSSFRRYIPPTDTIPLWHCPNPSCGGFHRTHLKSIDMEEWEEAELLIHNYYNNIERNSWQKFYNKTKGHDNYYKDDRADDYILMFADTFSEKEIKIIFKSVIDNVANARSILPLNSKLKSNSQKIVERLNKAECFQLLLLYDSREIIRQTELSIDKKQILIPPTEIRVSSYSEIEGHVFDAIYECNCLGFRSRYTSLKATFPRLKHLILDIYKDSTLQQQLEWNLRNYEGNSLGEKLELCMVNENPHEIVKRNILNGPFQIRETFNKLLGFFELPTTKEDDELIVNKILWKLGFDINIYPSILTRFWERLELFQNIVDNTEIYTDREKDIIRSSSINLFVSLEEILKHTVSYIIWVLLSDHYMDSMLKYNYDDALNKTFELLNGYKINEDTCLEFKRDGNNTLYPLIEGLKIVFKVCDNILDLGDKSKYIRSENELPHFYGKADIISFPFHHKILLLDISSNSYAQLRQIAFDMTQDFAQKSILSIRNTLEHDRAKFPTKTDLLRLIECLRKHMEKVEINLFPNIYFYSSTYTDNYQRTTYTFKDYKNRAISYTQLTNYDGSDSFKLNAPLIINPILHFKDSTLPIIFEYTEFSDYYSMWRNYPLKKKNQ